MIKHITDGKKPNVVEEILAGADKVVDIDGYIVESDDGEMLSETWSVVTQDIGMMLTTVYMVTRHAGEPFKVEHMTFTPRELDVLSRAAETWK